MNTFKNRIFKKIFSFALMMAMVLNMFGLNSFTLNAKAADYVTIYFVDNTAEKWVSNDSAVMELVDNTYGHTSYMMTKESSTRWSVRVPASAYNITFNRYNPSKTTKWNSWSAGGRDGNNAYSSDGHEYGHWYNIGTQSGFKAGDVIYLDLSGFTSWENAGAIMYANFTSASKDQNNGSDVNISTANRNLYQPRAGVYNTGNHIYRYVVTSSDEGKTTLRFWRGNSTTLWNCSATLSYSQYKSGYNCIKVTNWDKSGYVYIR